MPFFLLIEHFVLRYKLYIFHNFNGNTLIYSLNILKYTELNLGAICIAWKHSAKCHLWMLFWENLQLSDVCQFILKIDYFLPHEKKNSLFLRNVGHFSYLKIACFFFLLLLRLIVAYWGYISVSLANVSYTESRINSGENKIQNNMYYTITSVDKIQNPSLKSPKNIQQNINICYFLWLGGVWVLVFSILF